MKNPIGPLADKGILCRSCKTAEACSLLGCRTLVDQSLSVEGRVASALALIGYRAFVEWLGGNVTAAAVYLAGPRSGRFWIWATRDTEGQDQGWIVPALRDETFLVCLYDGDREDQEPLFTQHQVPIAEVPTVVREICRNMIARGWATS